MTEFIKCKINQEDEKLIAKLKSARRSRKLSISDAARESGINYKYAQAIEAGKFGELPKGLYQKKYIKEYAAFLGIDCSDCICDIDQAGISKPENSKLFVRKTINYKVFIVPRILKNALILCIIVVCFGYLFDRFENVITPPELQVDNPAENTITENHSIKIDGNTESETQVMINGNQVLSDNVGNFSQIVNLRSGLNTIIITAKKKFGNEKTIVKQVLVKDRANN
jgi:cytoskeletal protein RodZ